MASNEERARALAVAGDFGGEALELNSRLVVANPTDAASRTRLGRCYLEAGRLDEAEAAYREALRLDPRNRIAAGGLEMIERKRQPVSVVAAARSHAPRPARARAEAPPRTPPGGVAVDSAPIPQIFTGFGPDEFSELANCPRRDVQARFGPRVLDLVRRVNALPSSAEIAGIRAPGKRQLFRTARADVHAGRASWSVFNLGGRSEAQFSIAMYAGRPVGNWLRAGIGFNLIEDGIDPNRADAVVGVRDHFRRFQDILSSPRRSLFLGWMVKESGYIEHNECGPRLDLREPSQAAGLILESGPGRTAWLFFGKWLSLDRPEDAASLADPVNLVRTIDRVFLGLVPLWRTFWE